ncbi:MAG: hypothetical protein L0312_23445 [Acidobacteria bacterium]|nr:hypothetical protein [Acidobacteriota bacterium]
MKIFSIAVIWFGIALTFHSEAQPANHQKASQSQQSAGQAAPTQTEQKWESVVPEKPRCELQSNLTVDLSWAAVSGADSYVIYWSQQRNFDKKKAGSTTTRSTFFNHKERQADNRNKLPMYYWVAAIKNGVESRTSDACLAQLLSSNGGRGCQIDGDEAVGYCPKRGIYVCSSHNVFTDDHGSRWRCP